MKLNYRTVLRVNKEASLRNVANIWQRLSRWRSTQTLADMLGSPRIPVYFSVWRERQAEIGSEFQPDTNPAPTAFKSIDDYQGQLKAKRKRK